MKLNLNTFVIIVLSLSLVLNFFLIRGRNDTSDETFVVPKVIIFKDTNTILNLKDSTIIKYKTVRLKIANNSNQSDTSENIVKKVNARLKDSCNVIIPITQKKYSTANYTAYVSGYDVHLDSLLCIFKPEPIKIITKKRTKVKKWAIGPQLGTYYNPGTHKFNYYVGVGVTFIILSW